MHRREALKNAFGFASLAGAGGSLLAQSLQQPGALPRRGGTLRIALLGLDTSDPHRHTGSIGVQQVFVETLVSIGDDGAIKPFLAERFELSEDGKTYVFHLRKNVLFHNGRTLAATDIQANLERVRDIIKGGWLAGAMSNIAAISTPDALTVKMVLTKPFAPFLNLLSELWILAPESEGWNSTIRKPIGTGPFRFGTWQPNVRFVAPAFKQYWQPGLPYLDNVQFELRGDQDNSLSLRAGDLDVAVIRSDKVAALRADRIEVQLLGDTTWYFLSFNNRKPTPLMQDRRVREAIAHAIDKGACMNFIGGKEALVSNQPVRPQTFYWDQVVERQDAYGTPNLAKARELLRAAGVDPTRHTLKVISGQFDYAQAEVQMVRRLGFKINHVALDDIGTQRALATYDWDLAPSSSGPRADVYLRYARLLSNGPSPMLWGGIQDKELDALIATAVASPSIGQARRAYQTAWKRVMDKMYTVGIGHAADMIGVDRRVRGYRTGFTWSQNRVDGGLARVWLSA